MPHKTRYDKFMEFYARHGIDRKIKRFPETPSCADFHSQDFYIPGVSDLAEYIHKLNLLVKSIRGHSLDCRRCANQLEALLLSQADAKLFSNALGKILDFESYYDEKKHIYVAGLPYPQHESNPQTGRIVYVAPRLPIKYAVWEFLGRVHEQIMGIEISQFKIEKKHDGKRNPCYDAKAHLLNDIGYVSIRSRHKTEGEESYDNLRFKPLAKLKQTSHQTSQL